jgi:hypothetical protein
LSTDKARRKKFSRKSEEEEEWPRRGETEKLKHACCRHKLFKVLSMKVLKIFLFNSLSSHLIADGLAFFAFLTSFAASARVQRDSPGFMLANTEQFIERNSFSRGKLES